jgi:hypothetical protein
VQKNFDLLCYNETMESLAQFSERLSRLPTQEACLEIAYAELTKKYRGYRLRTYLRFWELLERDLEKLWAREGFLHCTHMNRLLLEVLVQSGHFKPEDLRTRWTLVWLLSPHQYLEVHLASGKRVSVDIWGKAYGISFGDYAHGFNSNLLAISHKIP